MGIWVNFLAILNSAGMNTHVYVFVWTDVFLSLGEIPRSETVGSLYDGNAV